MADINNSLPVVNSKVSVKVASSMLTASLIITPPQNGGEVMTVEKIKAELSGRGVCYGVMEDVIESLLVVPQYNEPVLIAKGHVPQNGEDAIIKIIVDLEKSLKPKEREDGSVDFKSLDVVKLAFEGEILCEKTPATPGEPGMTVYGKPIRPKPGRDKPLPMGKNTHLSDDKLQLIASVEGQVEMLNGKITILDTLTIDGDVSTSTGNIDFPGNVVVSGGVLTGFSVRADGNIDVDGVVESADLTAGGIIVIRGGFNGGDTGKLTAGGDISCRFVQGGRVEAGGSLETTYIMNSDIHCGQSVNLSGKGLILGGHIIARSTVSANNLGSASSKAQTLIEVGNDPSLTKRSYEIPKEVVAIEKNIKSVSMLAKTFLELKEAGRLTPEQAEKLQKSLTYLAQLKAKKEELEEELEVVNEKLSEAGISAVNVAKTAYPGVVIIIGPDRFPLQEEYTFTSFKRINNEIVTSPLR